jgi:hypothetical protein
VESRAARRITHAPNIRHTLEDHLEELGNGALDPGSGQGPLAVSGQELDRQPGLSYPGVSEQQDDTQLLGRGSPLGFEFGEFTAATHQPNTPQ